MEYRELWKINPQPLIEARRLRGWSRKSLARAALVSPHTIAKMERGGSVFPQTARQVASTLHIPVDSLLDQSVTHPEGPAAYPAIIQIAREYYQRLNTSILSLDLEQSLNRVCEGLHPEICWSVASRLPLAYEGVYRGLTEVQKLLKTVLTTSRRTRSGRIETAVSLDAGRVAVIASEAVDHPQAGLQLNGSGVLLVTIADASTDLRIIQIHQSLDIVAAFPVTKS